MPTILTTARFFLFVLSELGYVTMIEHFFKTDKRLTWTMVFCGNIIVLYIFVFLHVLTLAANIMFYLGLALLVIWFFIFIKKPKLNVSVQLSSLWMIFYGVLLGTTLVTSHLEHYDNFSHWAVIVKFLYTQGQLPGAADKIIGFTSYPVGSSLFIYYVTHIVGFQAGIMLLAQFLILFSCMVSLFTIVRDDSRALITMMICTFITLFNYFNIAIRMNNLLVDFLLPMLTLAAIAGIYRYKHQIKLMTINTILIGATIAIVKNNGIIFVIIILGYYAYQLFGDSHSIRTIIKKIFNFAIVAAGTYLPLMVWNKHVKTTFPISKHEVSLHEYESIFGSKSPATIHKIIHKFVTSVFSLDSLSTKGVILINIILIASLLIIHYIVKRKGSLLRVLIATDVTILLYYVGIFLMFLVSMPTPEALQLAGFERYASSIVILGLGITAMVLAREIDASLYEQNIMLRNYRSYRSIHTKKLYQYSAMALLFISILMALSENNGIRYNEKQYTKTEPYRVERMTGNNMKLNHTHYLIVSTDAADVNSYLTAYVGKYYLYSPNVDAQENFIMDDDLFVGLLKRYQKVIILQRHFTFNAMTKKIYHKTYGPGIYSTKDILDQKTYVNDLNQ